MKLSEFTTEKAMDVLCEIAPHVINIFSDEDLMKELRRAIDTKKEQTMAERVSFVIGKVSKLFPIIFKKRKQDVICILAALNCKTEEQIASQNVLKTMGQIRDIVKDKELLDFFKSCTSMEGSE
jgi:mannitol/fructose-specific phosphotransferase system IIA component (Ntr-type)